MIFFSKCGRYARLMRSGSITTSRCEGHTLQPDRCDAINRRRSTVSDAVNSHCGDTKDGRRRANDRDGHRMQCMSYARRKNRKQGLTRGAP